MLNVVVGVSIAAFLALVVALVSGSVLFGWLTVAASAAGLLLLIVNELRQNRSAAEQQPDVPAQPREELVTSPVEEPTVAEEVEYDGAVLRPDIWPADHPVEQTRGDDDHTQPRQQREGEALRPDIWP